MITDPTEEYFKDGGWGWDRTRWRKLGLVWGYTDRYAESVSAINVDAGTQRAYGTAVPAGEVWQVMTAICYCSTSNPSSWRLGLYHDPDSYFADGGAGVVAWTIYASRGGWVMKEGDQAYTQFGSCLAGDDLHAVFLGYKMGIA
jgi:hypothetical protein